jgi:hypothetical protein
MEEKVEQQLPADRETLTGCEHYSEQCSCRAPVELGYTMLDQTDQFHVRLQLDTLKPVSKAKCILDIPDQESCPTHRAVKSLAPLPREVKVNLPLLAEGVINFNLSQGPFGALRGHHG